MSAVTLRNISKRFGSVEAIRSLDLDVADGEFLSLLGPSGCGKTTTLRIVAGLETPTTGEVLFDAEPVTHLPPPDREIAMVFQLNALYPYLSVRENIAFPLRAQRLSRNEIERRVAEVAETLGIAHLLDTPAPEVHPADGQRVAIAKAIVSEPRVFLFDEPFSHLDAHMRARMRAELKHLHETMGRTMLFVTHDQAEALALSDRIAVMRAGEIVQLGTPEAIFHDPVDRYVAEFVGTPPISLVEATLLGGGKCRIAETTLALPRALARHGLDGEAERSVLLAVRPRYVEIGPPESEGLPGAVEVVEPMGRETLVHVRIAPEVEFRALVPHGRRLEPGEAVRLTFREDHVLFFDPETGRRWEEGR